MTAAFVVVSDHGWDGQFTEAVAADLETAQMLAEASALDDSRTPRRVAQIEAHVEPWRPFGDDTWVLPYAPDARMVIEQHEVVGR